MTNDKVDTIVCEPDQANDKRINNATGKHCQTNSYFMSIYHYLQTQKTFDFEALYNRIAEQSPTVRFEQRAADTGYFWVDQRSTRGVEVTLENGLVTLRNTVLSNRHDYELTNFLAQAIAALFGGVLYETFDSEIIDEEDEDSGLRLVAREFPIFTSEQIDALQHNDTEVIRTIISQQDVPIAVFGPVRKTHFGPGMMAAHAHESIAGLTQILHNYILNGNYSLPDFDYGNVMQLGEGEDQKILKLLTNQTNCIIDKYDYILFAQADHYIAITNDTLNTILPAAWQRVDEYTIVAPVLPQEEFEALVGRALVLNQVDELLGK